MQFLDNRVRFLIAKLIDLYGRDPATILNLKKNIVIFSKVTAL